MDWRCGGAHRPRSWHSAPQILPQLDIFAVGEKLAAQGWYLDRQNRPDSLHATVHAGSAGTVSFLVEDLRRAVEATGKERTENRSTTYGQG